MESYKTKELMPYETIYKVVNDYKEAINRVSAAYELLGQAESLMKSITDYSYVLPRQRSLFHDDAKNVLNGLKSRAWAGILRKTQAHKFMTNSRYKTFEKSLEKPDELPPINLETVQDFVQNLIESAPDMLMEFVKETFDWLHPGAYSIRNYKTNQKSEYELQNKIIQSYVFSPGYHHGMRVGYHATQPMTAMDNAFHLLDGKGIPKNGSSILSAIETSRQAGKKNAETEYFKLKWYKNGNCHIEFKRMDLVNKMNQVAGENILKNSQ